MIEWQLNPEVQAPGPSLPPPASGLPGIDYNTDPSQLEIPIGVRMLQTFPGTGLFPKGPVPIHLDGANTHFSWSTDTNYGARKECQIVILIRTQKND